jgi:activator of 2-hydroxyglutaryl-CoA dehydratase
MPRATNCEGTYRIAGCDLGKSAAKFVVGLVSPDGQLSIEKTDLVEHDGRPMDAFRDWYLREDVASCNALGATGLHAEELAAPVLAGLPEGACLQAALPHVMSDGPLNLLSIGARGHAVLARSVDGRFQFLQNDKCSSGTGETMVKIAGRFGLSIEEADGAALAADESLPITSRCSVFAKSEMTHFGNQGRSPDALFRGATFERAR